MNRDWQLKLERLDWVHSGGSPMIPALVVVFDGHSSACTERLREFSVNESLPKTLDASFRIHQNDPNHPGVFGIGNRLTGEYLLEIEVDRTRIFEFVDTVHRYADETGSEVEYELWISAKDGLVMDYAMQVFPVFAADDSILRHRSILPVWVDF